MPDFRIRAGALLCAGWLWAASAVAMQACPQHFVAGRAPELRDPALAASTQALCFKAFGLLHSGQTRTPLWTAEHLTSERLAEAQGLPRSDDFHPEPTLPRGLRAELADYARSGYDRGHMAPNGDMPDRASQHDSFSLANMVPQDADNNRNLWNSIEQAVRKMARREGQLYVVTGPAFLDAPARRVGAVRVPSHLYKVVYSPRQGAAGAYFVPNAPAAGYQALSVAELERRIGISLLPGLPATARDRVLALPKPRYKQARDESHSGRKKHAKMLAILQQGVPYELSPDR